MRKFALWLLPMTLLASLGGCSVLRGKETLPKSATMVPGEYRVGPPDVLSIGVWKQPDLSVPAVQVRPDGKISLPLVGDIKVEGLTAREIKEAITERVKEYVTDPEVTVIVVQVNNPVIFIIGEVNRPGPISIRQNTTVLQAIAMAGGFSTFADKDDIHILRREGGKEYRFRFNYKKVVKGKDMEQNIYVRPGDVIVVED
jgi:polysaccharide export outer membrane protein